ncbi:MAG: hypothetical protein HY966_01710, partial [Ignavibacteriales bacterium]|nr:hypothetical protein [Ignavibacteriales bacterium]
MKFALITIFLWAALHAPLAGQARGDREIKRKEHELQKLRAEIQTYEKKLRESEKKEKATLERIDDLERQTGLIRQLIQTLRDEEQQLTEDIQSAKNSINELESKLHFLKAHYAGYVRSVYK